MGNLIHEHGGDGEPTRGEWETIGVSRRRFKNPNNETQ